MSVLIHCKIVVVVFFYQRFNISILFPLVYTTETLSPELLTTTSKDYQLGFQEGLRQSIRPQSSSNLEESRSARARLKKQRAREAQAQKIQQR